MSDKPKFIETHKVWAIGCIAEAAHDITAGICQPKVLVPEGSRLVVLGPSGNKLHPIAVSKENDESFVLAVSASSLRQPRRLQHG